MAASSSLVSEAWRSLGANLSTTVAATMTVLIGMFLLGLFIALGTWTVSWSNHVKKQLVVKVYFSPQATAVDKDNLARKLAAEPVREAGRHQVRAEGAGARADEEEVPRARQEPDLEPVPGHARGDAEQG